MIRNVVALALSPFVCSLPLAAQVVVTANEARQATRVLFAAGFERPAEVALHYGAVDWREEYSQALVGDRAAHFRLGTGYWASLHSNVELTFGKTRLPASVWYLGLHRSEKNAWSLTFMDSTKLHRTRLTSGATRDRFCTTIFMPKPWCARRANS